MRKPRPSRLASLLTLALLAACSDGTGPSKGPPALLTELPRPLTQAEAGIAQAANQFSFNLLAAAQAEHPDSTIFLSPLSASMALGMTMNGAAGTTFDQMRSVLGFGTLSQEEINAGYKGLIELLAGLDATSDMLVANSIWAAEGMPFVPEFLSAGREWFDAEVQSVNFSDPATLVLVNDWVKAKTGGKIPKLLDRFDTDVVMTLINAIYFKGSWRARFDPKHTSPGTFRGTLGNQSVPMMNRIGEILLAPPHPDYQAAELLYGNGAFAMTIMLPREGMSVPELVAGLTPASWATLVGGMVEAGRVNLTMPKLRMDYRRNLSRDLIALGMPDAFSGSANFSRLVIPPPALIISSVQQKTYLEINEEGTTAAAATAVQMGTTSGPPSFLVDRPFLLVLRERLSGTILFIGQISNIPPAS
ncbi:MAG TPA: serpin family protein [Gemmatimonadales bacterium]|nr:serpin family protein [Gemmatimonadales bacterium]